MSYVTGSANDMNALLTALRNACTSNGWSLAGNVLSKGAVFAQTLVTSGFLTLLGGTGIDGSNNLTGAAPNVARIGRVSTVLADIAWPVNYEIFVHSSPDEVYLVINYSVDCYQWMAFGASSIPDLPGSGCWFGASLNSNTIGVSAPIYLGVLSASQVVGSQGTNGICPGLFWSTSDSGTRNCMVNHGLDGLGWSGDAYTVNASSALSSMLWASPNAWNSESVLLPIQLWRPRTSGNKVSLVADLVNARFLRIDNHTPGEIVTIGSDKWKVFPFYKKNTTTRNGGGAMDHTGTFGFAVRYDGP